MTWRAFDLHPELPDGGVPAARWGPAAEERFDLLEGLLAEVALPFRRPERIPRTRVSLEAAEWVRTQAPAAFPAFHRSLFTAYWAGGRDIGDAAVVVELAAAAGADPAAVAGALDRRDMAAAVDRSTAEAVDLGVTGTPAWVFPGGFVVPGAQPREVLDRVVARLRERRLA